MHYILYIQSRTNFHSDASCVGVCGGRGVDRITKQITEFTRLKDIIYIYIYIYIQGYS